MTTFRAALEARAWGHIPSATTKPAEQAATTPLVHWLCVAAELTTVPGLGEHLHAVSTQIDRPEPVWAHVADDAGHAPAALRAAYGWLSNRTVTVVDLDSNIEVSVSGHREAVGVTVYAVFVDPADLDLIRSLPADVRLLDALAGDAPVPLASPGGPMSEVDRDRLRLAQATTLLTGGHTDRSLCKVLLGSPFHTPGSMCQATATHRVERHDYECGVSTAGQFRPGVVLTRVCAEHASVVEDEPGLISLTALDGAR